MNIVAYAAAKQTAIDEIGRKLGVDLRPQALPKTSDPKIQELFRLQKIAALTTFNCDCEAELIARISEIEGIGPSTIKKIRDGLALPRPDGLE